MKSHLFVLCLLLWSSAQAQQIRFGYKANFGINLTSVSQSSGDLGDVRNPPTLSYGVELPLYLKIGPSLWLRTGLGLQSKNHQLAIPTPDATARGDNLVELTHSMFAIQLPFLISWQFGEKKSWLIEAGGMLSRYTGISASMRSSSNGPGLVAIDASGFDITPSRATTVLPGLIASVGYFLPGTERIRHQIQLSAETDLAPATRNQFVGDIQIDNTVRSYDVSVEPQLATIKLSYTIFPFWP
ncbi:MAG: hypothetical protein AAGM67_01965 [Bacteroidota bacterium]